MKVAGRVGEEVVASVGLLCAVGGLLEICGLKWDQAQEIVLDVWPLINGGSTVEPETEMELEPLYKKMQFPGIEETVPANEEKLDPPEFVAAGSRPSNVSIVQCWGLNG